MKRGKEAVPSPLSGAVTWIGDIRKAANICDVMQNIFWRIILAVPESTPKIAPKCETKMLGMKWRIWLEKILMIVRFNCKDKGTLCKRIYDEGKSRGWPGLGEEVSKICDEIGIADVNNEAVPTKVIKEAIFNHHYADMKKELKKINSKLELNCAKLSLKLACLLRLS